MLTTDPKIIAEYRDEKRLWQGIPGIEVTARGRVFVTCYSGGVNEEIGNYVLLWKSEDGIRFGEPIALVLPQPGRRCYDPCLWIDPLGRLWLIWAEAPYHAVCAAVCEDPDAEEIHFGEERVIGHNVMMNKPTVLSTGEWLFPMAVWDSSIFEATKKDDTHEIGAYVYKTVDCGETFVPLGRALVPKRSYDEHMVLERKDGVLAMYVRTFYGIGISYSYDRGKTWSPGIDSGLHGPCSRFCIRRLRSGRVLLINHVDFTERNNLTALLSEDDGKTWPYRLLLDGRDQVSYPDLKEADDGYIYITYDRERGSARHSLQSTLSHAREILYAKITEQDIIEGRLADEGSRLQVVVNKLGVYRGEEENPYHESLYLSDKDLAAELLQTASTAEGVIDRLFTVCKLSCIELQNIHGTNIDTQIDRFLSDGGHDTDLLIEIIRTVRAAGEVKDPFPAVKWVMDYVDTHFAEECKVGDLAAQLHCSTYHICHAFKKQTGLTVTEYRNNKRLTGAKYRLVHTDEKIGDIAAACGYGDESYFCKIFRREEGVTPGRYRAALKQ